MDRLLITKLNMPPLRPGLVNRPRLTEYLNRGLAQGCRLTLISAPAGYGKTTVACEWLAGLTLPDVNTASATKTVAWLSLDEGDNDTTRFFAYLVAALRRIDSSLGQATLDFLVAPRLPAASTLMTPLINDLALNSGCAILVLDDLHAIRSLPIHDSLDFLIQHAPPNFHVVVLTREDPPLLLTTLRARGQVAELRLRDLRFSDEEAEAFFRTTMGLELEGSIVNGLEERTEGWIAGLQLAALSIQGRATEDLADFLAAFSGNNRYIMDYLIEQVLRRLPADLRNFMCATSILDRMCAPLCDAILEDVALPGQGDSKAMLQQLDAANLFLVRLDAQGHWFRFHHLLAELLRLEVDAVRQVSLHRRAAGWFEENRLLPEAIHHALAGEDYSRAARLVRESATDLLSRSEMRTLLRWTDGLPPDVVLQDAELAVHKAAALFFTGDAGDAFECLDQVEARLAGAALPPPIQGRLLAIRAWQADLAYRMDAVRQMAAQALELTPHDEPFYRMVALLPFGHAQSAVGETLQAEQTYRETVAMGRKAGHILVTVGGLVDLAFNLLEQGRRLAAIELCEDTLRRHLDRRGSPLPVAQLMYLPLATAQYQANKLEVAGEYAARGLEASRQMLSDAIMGGDGEMILALSEFAQHRPVAAMATLEDAGARAERLGYRRVALGFAALRAELYLREGKVAAARRWAESREHFLREPPVPAREMECRVYIRYLLAVGRVQEARALLQGIEDQARAGGRNARLIIALIWRALAERALASQGLSNQEAALRALKEAVSLAAPEDFRRVFLDADQPALIDLLAKVRPSSPEFVDAILRAGSADPGSSAADAPSQLLPEPLSARELEVLRLLAEGLSYRQIADRLIVAQGTVQAHCGSIYGKLGVNNRTQALSRARELHLL
jgi:LuxR family transcriptional regulator, maltose regulon positive regulatory protein